MTAKEAKELYGTALIGKKVFTEAIGEWPGGPATVIELEPDPNAPEIVFQVRSSSLWDPDQPDRRWEIGIFENEEVSVL
jgi:hypothetical protein